MSDTINSIDDLKKTSETTVEEPVVATKEDKAETTSTKKVMPKNFVDPREAALKRAEEAKAAEEARIAEAERRRKQDGRQYELEVEGFNIGDSIMRRYNAINETATELREAIAEEEIQNEMAVETGDIDSELEESLMDIDDDFLDKLDAAGHNPIEREEPGVSALDKKEEDVLEKNDISIFDSNDLASQTDMDIDDDDFKDLDLDFDEDINEDGDDKDSELSKAELNGLREAIKEKLSVKVNTDDTGKISISSKAVSLSAVLAQQKSAEHTADFPLMSAGHNVTMKEFSATDIESLNRGGSGRNRFNTMKDIYHTIFDHIVNEKRDFETWLKTTSFMDIDNYYMAAYKASFEGANYIPFNCENEQCNHIFLSDDIKFEDMIKFKDDEAKKKFYAIYDNVDVDPDQQKGLYDSHLVPISDTIAIGFREPTIYNTIFENSVLDQKFVDKYTRLLSTLVYIDNIYVKQGNEYAPVYCKVDRNSIAKTTKYRIVTFSKIIKSLQSDSYNNILAEIRKINNLGDEIKYQLPEITCPKCGQTIEAVEQQASQLLFSRHQLNLLSQQY